MKKFFTTLIFVALVTNLFSEISVKSFSKLDNDMDARINEPLKDQNGEVCAIVKVVTTQTGFTFDCGIVGIMKTVQKTSEVWVYIPNGAQRITIQHPQLGQIRDYRFTMPIEKATVYELVLITGRVETTVEEMTSQWLVINPEPADALIYLNDQYVKSGTFQSKLKPGSYSYRVEFPLYKNEAGKIEITDSKKEINVKLKPAFGYISVNTEPEAGAKVIINGKNQLQTTPFQSEPLASGEYNVQVVKEMYQPASKTVIVVEGLTAPVNFVLQPNFGEITIIAPTNATLYVNNQQKGFGTWKDKLNAGIYYFEARLDKHRPDKKELNVLAGGKDTIRLDPKPIYGSLDIMSNPSGASITIDGKEYGTTPNTVNNLPIGDCNVKLVKSGYNPLNTIISITDGRTTAMNETLTLGAKSVDSQMSVESTPTGRIVLISSNPSGANLFIDNNPAGQTPYNGMLTFGNHTLRIEQGMEKVEKIVYIDKISETNFKLTFAQQAFMETTSGLLDVNENAIQTKEVPFPQKPTNILGQSAISVNSSIKSIKILSIPSNADLYVDGRLLGKTPISIDLQYGKHSFIITNGAKKNAQELDINNETSNDLFFQLYDCYSTKSISSFPIGAIVTVNGEEKGITPLTYKMLNKEDVIVISQKGYKSFKTSISCDNNGLSANLIAESKKRTRLYLEGNITFPLIQSDANNTQGAPIIDATSSFTDSLIYSFRLGLVKTTGLYLKLTTNMSSVQIENTVNDLPNSYYYIATSPNQTMYTSRFGLVGGLMLNVKPVMFYVGAGYGYYNHYIKAKLYNYTNNSVVKSINLGDSNSISDIEYDAGLVFYSGFGAFSIGFSSIGFKYNELNFGLGILF